MKLREALPLLKDDGSNWIYNTNNENFRIRLLGETYKLEEKGLRGTPLKEWGYSLKNIFPANDNWQLHSESKFKVGDLVAYKRFENDGEIFGKITKQYNNSARQSYAISASCFSHDESYLKLIMPAQELAEKLGGSEND